MKIVSIKETVKKPKNKAVRLWDELEDGQAIEFDDYEKMRSAYFAVRSYIKNSRLNYKVKQHSTGHPPGYYLMKEKFDA